LWRKRGEGDVDVEAEEVGVRVRGSFGAVGVMGLSILPSHTLLLL
jgi:hypothetical protein